MGRILALDYGRKRVGVAVTDPLQISANGLDTIATHELFPFLNSYIGNEDVDCLVIGYGKKLNNEESESVTYLRPFLERFKKEYPEMKIEFIDERFTSKIAQRTIIDAGARKKTRQNKALIDKVSATIILQSYLEMRTNLSK